MNIKNRILNWRVAAALSLVLLSFGLYVFHYSLFHDKHHILLYFWEDLAFIPIEVLVVTMIIHHLLSAREKRNMFKKLNMLIGAFYSDSGSKLLRFFSGYDPTVEELRARLKVDNNWSPKKFEEVRRALAGYGYKVTPRREELKDLHVFLSGKMDFLLNLLANPNLLEHESFTELLWAVFHLAEELGSREDFAALPESDLEHISGDIKRAYRLLSCQWLDYMGHLKREYPYLFSLAMRTNPFYPGASAVVKG